MAIEFSNIKNKVVEFFNSPKYGIPATAKTAVVYSLALKVLALIASFYTWYLAGTFLAVSLIADVYSCINLFVEGKDKTENEPKSKMKNRAIQILSIGAIAGIGYVLGMIVGPPKLVDEMLSRTFRLYGRSR